MHGRKAKEISIITKIKWKGEEWEVKYYPGRPGRWSLERPFVTVSWFLYFQ